MDSSISAYCPRTHLSLLQLIAPQELRLMDALFLIALLGGLSDLIFACCFRRVFHIAL